jgi:D-alanyl-D-alanine carboxypeptidase (penicillin-binding protein 5/6)
MRQLLLSGVSLLVLISMVALPARADAKAQPAKVAAAKASPKAAAMEEEGDAEAGLDLTLRSTAAAQPVVTADSSALETPASHMVLVDYDTGAVLASKAADMKMYPSSMTKMMTLYIIFDKLKQGTLMLNSQFTVSERAWRMQGSKMFVPIHEQIGLEDLIRGIAIQSGNDACVVVAEGIAGSEESFANLMNETAKQLGMTTTRFTDASGWPHPDHTTTPHDLAVLASAIIRNFPEYYHYVSEREFVYHNIRQFNRNLLLGNSALGVDGLKTGHTDAAGYGITLSAKDKATGRRLVLVTNGLHSDSDRASEGERLLNWGFRNFDDLLLFKAGSAVSAAKVAGGKALEVSLTTAKDVVATIPKIGRDKIKITVNYNGPLIAPIAQGQEVGTLVVALPNGDKREVKLVTASAVERLSFFGRFFRKIGL